MTHLAELPGEVIHLICNSLEDRDLFRLGFTCRYLHRVVYPISLGRRGIGSGEGNLADLRRVDVRRAITSSLFPIRTFQVVLPIDVGGNGAEVGCRLDPVTALQLLKKVDRVQEVHVKIGSSITLPEVDARRSLTHSPAPAASDSMVFSGWERLMNTLLIKAQCRTLLVDVDDHQCEVSSEMVEAAILEGYYSVKGRLNWLRLQLGCIIVTPFRWFGIELSPVLEEFHVHSPILFHASLCHWTLSVLRQPTLTSLSLDNLQWMTPATWDLLLPLITIPNLTKLSINLCSMPTEALYAFLARHPQLEELSLGPKLLPLDPNSTLPKNGLCRLRALTGTAEQLVVLLSSSTLPTVDTLKTVRVLYRTRRGSRFLANAINNDLAPICFRLRSINRVILSVFIETPATDWVVQPSPGNKTHFTFTDPIEVAGSNLYEVGPSQSWSSHDSRLTASMTFTGSCVTELEFKFNIFLLPAPLVIGLPRWLEGFDKMARFDLLTASATLDGNVPFGKGKTTGPSRYGPPWEQPHHEEAFLHGVRKNCPTVKVVSVNGKELPDTPLIHHGRRRIKKLV